MEEVILLVDDKPANILVLESLLVAPNRRLLKATSGKEALKFSLNHEIDLIILDVQMPDMNGFEVAQVLKTNKRTSNIPIIFATAERQAHASVIKGYGEGAVDYLLKPLDPEVVKAKVKVLLKLQQQKRELLIINASLERSALLIENSADIIGIINAGTWKIEEINRAFTEILGYNIDDVIGKTLMDFSHEHIDLNNLNKKDKEYLSFENEMMCSSGSRKWLHWKVRIKDEKWYVNARDITETKIADEQIHQLNKQLQHNITQLELTNKELESFSYSISHDLRAPLRALNGFAKIIEEEYISKLDHEAKRLLHHIQDNAVRMGMLIDDLLAFSRLGRKEVNHSLTDMRYMAEMAATECRQQFQNAALINIADLPPVLADHALMKQVWLNLISNAFKYSSKKLEPRIEIGWKKTKNTIHYYVKDNGVGFDMKYAEKLFGVFQRLHSDKQFEGTGVGLAIVHRIITKHGGQVWAEAKENEGAIFYFTVPDS